MTALDQANDKQTAHVETLTATVRTLVVGSRQVTLSVARQLDWVDITELNVMGRVRLSKGDHTEVIGSKVKDGSLAIARLSWGHWAMVPHFCGEEFDEVAEGAITVCSGIRPNPQDEYALRVYGVRFTMSTPKYDSSVKRCDVEGHVYGRGKCEGFEASPATIELIRKEVARQAEEISRRRRLIEAAEDAPLIVLAGLR